MTKKIDTGGTTAIQRNPSLSKGQAQKCDSGLHKYTSKDHDGGKTIVCVHCGMRKGGLPPLKVEAGNSSDGQASASGTLSDASAK